MGWREFWWDVQNWWTPDSAGREPVSVFEWRRGRRRSNDLLRYAGQVLGLGGT